MAEARRDQNFVTSLLGVSSVDGSTPVVVYADPVTHALLTSNGAGGSGTVTDVSVVTANGISGSVANSTTTPAITLTLGNITPTTVNGLTLAAQAVGFTIAGGTTSKTLTVPLDASVSGTNTGDQDLSGLVPYTGATGDVTLGVHGFTAASITDSGLTASKPVFTDGLKILTSSGTVPLNQGGTGQTTKSAAFDALSPMSTAGDIIYGGAAGTGQALAIGTANQVLHGGASAPAYSTVVEADITLANNTTNNVSTARHGFTPQLPNLTTQFLRGDGAWAAPASVTVPNAYLSESFAYTANVAHNIVHNFGTFPVTQAFDNSGNMVVPLTIQNTDVNTVAVTFSTTATFTLILTIGSPPLTAYTNVGINYTMVAGDYFIEETGAGTTVTLLTVVGRTGKIIVVKNSSAGNIDVTAAGGEFIDSGSTITLASFDSVSLFSDGSTTWHIW